MDYLENGVQQAADSGGVIDTSFHHKCVKVEPQGLPKNLSRMTIPSQSYRHCLDQGLGYVLTKVDFSNSFLPQPVLMVELLDACE